jgi:hypothetical protein
MVDCVEEIKDKRIIIHPRCTKTIDSLQGLAWLPDKRDLESITKYDHPADSLRYFFTGILPMMNN